MSPLQTQYPLSPRKFWKKMFGSIIMSVVLFLILGGMLLLTGWALQQSSEYSSTIMLAGTVVFGLFGIIIFYLLLRAWYWRVYIRRYYYDAGDNFATIKKGVFAPAEIHVLYQKIQDVYVDQDILDRMMGLYDVHLASATSTSGMEAHIDGVEHDSAEAIKNLLLSKIQSGGTSPASAGSPSQPTAPQVPNVVALSEDVSSNTYPLSGTWVTQQIILAFFSSLFFSVVIDIWLFSQGNNTTASVGSSFGISPTALLLPVFLVVFAAHIIWTFLWKSTYSFVFLPEYIQMRSGIISRSEVHVPYRAVQDVTVTQGVIERVFGLSTVNIENAAQAQMVGRTRKKTGVTIPGQTLDKANHIAEVVRSVTLTKNTGQTGL